MQKNSILDHILWCNEQHILPTNPLNESTIGFQLGTDRNILTDLQSTQIFFRGRGVKGDRASLYNTEETLLVNNALHSLFCNCEVYLKNEKVHSANSPSTHQFLSLQSFHGQKERNKGYLNAKDINMRLSQMILQYEDLQILFLKNIKMNLLFTVLAIGLFACETFLLPNVNLRVKLIRSSLAFYIIDTGGLKSKALILKLAFLIDRQQSQITG